MRRLSVPSQADGPRLVLLAEALGAAVPSATLPDPGHQQQQEIDRNVEAARRAGEARGLADAEAVIARRVEEIAVQLRLEHERECRRLEAQAKSLATLVEAINAALAGHARDAEDVAVEAAYSALVRVLGDKAAERTLMHDLCLQALELQGVGNATLRISPDDMACMDLEGGRLPCVADATLRPGQCVLETSRGASDTGLDVRLQAITRAFLDGLSAHRQRP